MNEFLSKLKPTESTSKNTKTKNPNLFLSNLKPTESTSQPIPQLSQEVKDLKNKNLFDLNTRLDLDAQAKGFKNNAERKTYAQKNPNLLSVMGGQKYNPIPSANPMFFTKEGYQIIDEAQKKDKEFVKANKEKEKNLLNIDKLKKDLEDKKDTYDTFVKGSGTWLQKALNKLNPSEVDKQLESKYKKDYEEAASKYYSTLYGNIEEQKNALTDLRKELNKIKVAERTKENDPEFSYEGLTLEEIKNKRKELEGEIHGLRTSIYGEFSTGEYAASVLKAGVTGMPAGLIHAARSIVNFHSNAISGKDIWQKTDSEKLNDEYNEQVAKYGEATNTSVLGQLGVTVVRELPTVALSMMLAPAKAAELGVQAVTNSEKVSAFLSQVAKNPLFWSSYVAEYGDDYDNAMDYLVNEKGMSRGDAAAVATGIATLGGAAKAYIEIGGGIETLPQELKLAKTSQEKFFDWLASSGEEGLEEVVQRGITEVEKLMYGDTKNNILTNADWNDVKDLSNEFGMGVLGGMALSGITVTVDSIINAKSNAEIKTLGEQVKAIGLINPIVDFVKQSNNIELKEYVANTPNAKITNENAGRLYQFAVNNIVDTLKDTSTGDVATNLKSIIDDYGVDNLLVKTVAIPYATQMLTENEAQSEEVAKTVINSIVESSLDKVENSSQANDISEQNSTSEPISTEPITANIEAQQQFANQPQNNIELTQQVEAQNEISDDDVRNTFLDQQAIEKGSISQKDVAKLKKFSKKSNVKVRYRNLTVRDNAGNVVLNPDGKINADNSITINVNAKSPVAFIIRHELTHIAKSVNRGEWNEFLKITENSDAFNNWFAKKDLEYRKKAERLGKAYTNANGTTLEENYKARYSKVYGNENIDAKIKEEMVCDFVGEMLFGDKGEANYKKMLNAMKPEQRNKFAKVMQKIIDKLKEVFGLETEIDRIEKAWSNAWQSVESETKTAEENGGGEFSFAGENANNANISLLKQAEEMENSGADSESIRKETGWFKGYDGRWRFEIDDSEASMIIPDWYNNQDMYLPEILKHDKLYEAYPQLKNVIVTIDNRVPHGAYVPANSIDSIGIYKLDNSNLIKSMLLHEAQHIIQNIEGFSKGATTKQFSQIQWGDKEYEAYENCKMYAQKLYNVLRRHGVQIDKDYTIGNNELFFYEVDDNLSANYSFLWTLAENNKRTEALLDGYYDNYHIIYRTTPSGQYNAVAGEIEAYDTQARAEMTAEQRKNTRPNIDRTDAIVLNDRNISFDIVSEFFNPINEENKHNILSRNDIVISSEKELEEKIRKSLGDKYLKENYALGSISNETKDRITRDIGRNIFKNGEYVFLISSDDIRHLKDHFSKNEEIKTALLRLYDVVNNYDDVELFINSDGTQTRLIFNKQYSDYDFRSVEIASKKKRSFDLVTFFVTKNNKKGGQNSSPAISENIGMAARGVSPSNNSIPNTPENVNNEFSIPSDTEYLELAKDPEKNETKLREMVGNAAKNAGYNSPMLYHGTTAFGFTQFERMLLDDRRSIFLTDSERIASTYSGVEGKRNINDKAVIPKNISSIVIASELNANMPDYEKDNGYSYMAFNEQARKNLVEKIKAELGQVKMFLYTSPKLTSISESDLKTLNQLKAELDKTYNPNSNNISTPLYLLARSGFFAGWRDVKVLGLESNIRLAQKMSNLESNEDLIAKVGLDGYDVEVYTKEEARNLLAESQKRGNYALYLKSDNSLKVDCNGNYWNKLKYRADISRFYTVISGLHGYRIYNSFTDQTLYLADNETGEYKSVDEAFEKVKQIAKEKPQVLAYTELDTTRQISKYADLCGYSGVEFRDIADNGGSNDAVPHNETSNIYIAFDNTQVKSADLVTYDDNGNIIPLSERFNSENEDIRYSVPLDEKYWYPDMSKKEIDRVKRIAQYEVNTTNSYLNNDTKWLYNDRNGTPYFALYSASSEEDPTILYACKGNRAAKEKQWLNNALNKYNGGNLNDDQKAGIVDRILKELGNDGGKNIIDSRNAVNRRSDNGNAAADSRKSSFRPSAALLNCLENIARDEERPEISRRKRADGLTPAFSMPDSTIDELIEQRDNGDITEDEFLSQMNALYQSKTENGVIEQGENPAENSLRVPKSVNEGKKVERFARTVGEVKGLSEETKDAMKTGILQGKFDYEPISNKALVEEAVKGLETGETQQLWKEAIGKTVPGAEYVAAGEVLLNNAKLNNDKQTFVDISADLAMVFTRAGRLLQASRIIKRLDGEGRLIYLQRVAQHLSSKQSKKITIDPTLAEMLVDAKGEQISSVEALIQQNIGEQIESSWVDKWNALRYIGMLLNPKTHFINIIGNTIFAVPFYIKGAIASTIEAGFNIEERTKAFGIIKKEYREFAKNYSAKNEIRNLLKTGRMEGDTGISENMKVFKTKWLEAIRKFSGSSLEAEDFFFKNIHFKNAFAGYLQANKVDVSKDVSKEILQKATEYAYEECLKATFNDANSFSEYLNSIRNFDKSTRGRRTVRAAGIIATDALIPFRRTTANIVKRGFEYSPLGLLKTLSVGIIDLNQGKINMAEFIDDISAGLTGTGIAALGAVAYIFGFITLGWDKDDEEGKLDKLKGGQEYAVQIGNTSYTIDWAAPTVLPFFLGAEIGKMIQEKELKGEVLTRFLQMFDPVVELSLLQGLDDTLKGVSFSNEKPIYAIIGTIVSNYITQPLPSFGGAVSRIIDPVSRSRYYTDKNSYLPAIVQQVLNNAKSRTPGLSSTLPATIDLWGRKRTDNNVGSRIVTNTISPGYFSSIENTKVSKELERLYEKTGQKVLPSYPEKYIDITKGEGEERKTERKNLTAKEYEKFATLKGQYSLKYVTEFINHGGYKGLTDAEKVEVLGNIYKFANAKAKSEISDYDLVGATSKKKVEYDKAGQLITLLIFNVTRSNK